MTIRVLLADDQALLRSAFRVLVDSEPDMEVVGEASDGAEAVRLAKEERADVVLMDIRMPGTDGLAATRMISADPTLAQVRVVILTTFEVDDYVVQSLRAGCLRLPRQGLRAGRAAERDPGGRRWRGTAVAHRDQGPHRPLPRPAGRLGRRRGRCRRPLRAALRADQPRARGARAGRRGLSNDEIAELLEVSPLTVKTHVNRAMAKLGARDRAQLVVFAYESGLVRPRVD